MKYLLALSAATVIMATIAIADTPAKDKGARMLKAVVHINFNDSERQEHGLGNIENILKEVPNAEIEVVSHGEGITLLVTKETKQAEKIQALMKQGVRFAACENTMKKQSIAKEDLVAGVTTVPSGAVEVLRKQQEGFSYFRP